VGGIQTVKRKLIANVRPADFARQLNVQRLIGEMAQFKRRNDWRRVYQRDKADPDPAAPGMSNDLTHGASTGTLQTQHIEPIQLPRHELLPNTP
jgi:hypothetical protein